MALTSARQILNKKILGTGDVPSADEIPIDIAGLSATKLSVGLEEIVLDINQLSASVLTIDEKVENATAYSTSEEEVGTWIDGSKVYKRTVDLGDSGVKVGVGASVSSTLSSDGINAIIKAEAISPTLKAFSCFGGEISGSYINMLNLGNAEKNVRYYTVYYTKTPPTTSKKTTRKSIK